MKRIHIIARGRVQGVFYRDHVKKSARKYMLSGWVKNKSDRTVEAVAEGEENLLKEFLKACQKGNLWAKVEDVEFNWEKATGEFEGFTITY